MADEKSIDLTEHLSSFRDVWSRGYFSADPLLPDSTSLGLFGYFGSHHVVYLCCIRPYVDSHTVAVEIGPGRGAWTRALLPAQEVWCLDALSAEHNEFWTYVGQQSHVHYSHVKDFDCDMLPDDGVDYVFSYDALCHVPFNGLEAYARSLYRKMRRGAHGFWMVGDFDKFRSFVTESRSVGPVLTSQFGRRWARQFAELAVSRVEKRQLRFQATFINQSEGPGGNWWYDAGAARTATMLTTVGYQVLDEDMGCDPRSPILHFVR